MALQFVGMAMAQALLMSVGQEPQVLQRQIKEIYPVNAYMEK
jgi:hypothetical protein